jgi:O-antigen/teichoic acid export membrane protein
MTLSAGVWLMIASYSANFVVGFGKMVVQWRWDKLTFGKVSLAFGLTTIALRFVTAISVVLFPSIKRLDKDKLPGLYKSIRDGISPLFLLVLIFYFPGSYLLKLWLPKYVASIVYLGILLPIIVYSSKVSLLTNNYLKAYRKEKTLLVINILSVVFGFVVYLILTYVFNNLFVLLFSIVGIIMIRSIVSEIAVMKIIKVKILFDIILEVIITSIFIVCAVFFSRTIGFFMYAIAIIIYFCIKRRSIANLLLIAKKYKK